MADAQIIVLADRSLGQIQGPLWGQFLELRGRCIHGGIFGPQGPNARPDGLRRDVLEPLRALRPTHVRYPGGCAAAYFDWQELVGPIEQRPVAKLSRATNVEQSTAFGIPEAFALCQELGAELYLTVNAHTQSPQDAANLVEYLNGTRRTRYAELRRQHGREEPYRIRLFGLGNEIYGDWQPGVKTAPQYVEWCREAIAQMKLVDPSIQIVCCGSGRFNPDWDRVVLKGLIDRIDMISVHNYFGRPIFADSMAASLVCEQMFNAINVAIDEAMDTLPARRERPGLAFDEWNVWYRSRSTAASDLEEIYDYTDALTVASLIHVLLRNLQSIRLSNISLAVNTLGLLFTDATRCAPQTIYFPHVMLRDGHAGDVVFTLAHGPTFAAKHDRYFSGVIDVEKARDETVPSLLHFRDVPALDVLTSIDRDRKRLCMSVVQKLPDRALTTQLDFRGVEPKGERVTVQSLTTDSVSASNTLDAPDRVGVTTTTRSVGDVFTFPPASLTMLTFDL